MSEVSIEIDRLEFSYGREEVLKGVDLQVPEGSIFGFLGRNGAGKTTTIKLLLGLLKPDDGFCRIEGIDSQKNAISVRRIVGYMAEDQQMYGWMRVEEIIDWVSCFYPNWDKGFSSELMEMLELPGGHKVKSLSKGQNSRLAFLLALGHRPGIVILDDPTLGLDPIARKDFLRYVIELLQSEGVTVFFSSHLLYEIEPVADRVAILDGGVIVRSGETDELRGDVKKFVLSKKVGLELKDIDGVLDVDVSRDNGSVTITCQGCDEAKRKRLKGISGGSFQEFSLNLDEIFEAYVIGNRGEGRL